MSIKVSGGGGSGYPGVSADNQTPGGLVVKGEVAIGSSDPGGATGTLLDVRDNAAAVILQAISYGNGSGIDIEMGGTGQVSQVQVNTSSTSSGLYAFRVVNGSGSAAAIMSDGSLQLRTGLGLYGSVPSATTPRTLAQATITAITDANAKTAVQALANALVDIGALTLT